MPQIVARHARHAVERSGRQRDRTHVGLLQGAGRDLLAAVSVAEEQPAVRINPTGSGTGELLVDMLKVPKFDVQVSQDKAPVAAGKKRP